MAVFRCQFQTKTLGKNFVVINVPTSICIRSWIFPKWFSVYQRGSLLCLCVAHQTQLAQIITTHVQQTPCCCSAQDSSIYFGSSAGGTMRSAGATRGILIPGTTARWPIILESLCKDVEPIHVESCQLTPNFKLKVHPIRPAVFIGGTATEKHKQPVVVDR